MHDQQPSDWTKSGAPLAHLLNGDITAIYNNHHQHAADLTQNASAAHFSGKLVDLLLDPADVPSKHRRTESNQQHHVEPNIPSTMGVSENQVIQLPKPPQLPKQTTKRPRIPPLLQGLHQPPPLPPAERLFPPITEGVRTDVDVGGEEKQKDDASIAVPVAPAKSPATTSAVAEQGEGSRKSKVRKRRKWSDEETKDLLVGVSRFGIGSWKRILQCEDFKFHGRTAVDLKDRFRVCCPGEGLKARKDARKDRTQVLGMPVEKGNVVQGQHIARKSANESSDETATKKTSKSHQIDPTERAKMGIEAPFVRNPRRYRQNFTPQNDRNLWRGYEKHGPIWHIIRDDEDLGFTDRHPTDLRDRFRIRYPQAFANAGFKLKPSTQKAIELADGNVQKTKEQSHVTSETRTTNTIEHPATVRRPTRTITDTPIRIPEQDVLAMSILNSKHTAQPFSFGPGPSWLDDMPNTSFDPVGSESPIILNRDILQWADSNNFSTPTANSRQHINDIMNNDITPINDGFHIDPMATLKLPFMALQPPASSSSMPHLSGTSSTGQRGLLLTSPPHNVSQHHIPLNLNTNPVSSNYLQIHTHDTPSQTHIFAKPPSSSSNHLLRTPNLPTIVFPHVPVASARNAVHNLPTPADLLSGLGTGGDVDMGVGEFGVVLGNGGTGYGQGHG